MGESSAAPSDKLFGALCPTCEHPVKRPRALAGKLYICARCGRRWFPGGHLVPPPLPLPQHTWMNGWGLCGLVAIFAGSFLAGAGALACCTIILIPAGLWAITKGGIIAIIGCLITLFATRRPCGSPSESPPVS